MIPESLRFRFAAGVALALMFSIQQSQSAFAQTAGSAADAATAETAQTSPEPLSEAEMEILVARIALYPDELVSVIVSSALFPVQIVQAQRYFDNVKAKPDLKPDSNWDGSVISLMNYPEIVKMMSDDLDWTQTLGEAITNQQQDVLTAIQQLRAKAVAEGIIKTDDKIKVVKEKENIVIQPASTEVIYVPQYQPEVLYEPSYVPAPIAYYPNAYPYYYNPVAPFFAGFVTGAVWGSVVDWNNHGIWGGHGNWGNDVNINCNHCLNNNNFSGKINVNNVDWNHVDRSKISFDNNQINRGNKTSFSNSIKSDKNNSIAVKSADLKKTRTSSMPTAGKSGQVSDVRKSTIEGLQGKTGGNVQKPGQGATSKVSIPAKDAGGAASKPGQGSGTNIAKPAQGVGNGVSKPAFDRPVGDKKPAALPDTRPKSPSPIGDINRGAVTNMQSNRGAQSMGGGISGGAPKNLTRPNGGGGGGAVRSGGGGRGGGGGKQIRPRKR